MMLLNGLPVDGASLELYPLLDKIAGEVCCPHAMHCFSLSRPHRCLFCILLHDDRVAIVHVASGLPQPEESVLHIMTEIGV